MRAGKRMGVVVIGWVCAAGLAWASGPAKAKPQPRSAAAAPAAKTPTPTQARSADVWSGWAPLLGSWQPDDAKGSFSFERGLNGHVLIRHNRLEVPAANGRPAQHHADLMVVYRVQEKVRAHYFDNEGHDIQYTAAIPRPGRFELVSDKVAGQPRFRLVYALTAPGKVDVTFEIAPPNAPDQFRPYLKGSAHRIAGPAQR